MSKLTGQGHYLGTDERVRAQLAEALGMELQPGYPAAGGEPSDVAFLEAFTDPGRWGEIPGGNVFTACRALKSESRMRVYVLVHEHDQVTPEVARFCLADGSLAVGEDGLVDDPATVRARLAPHEAPVEVDALLVRLEREIASDEGRQRSALQRMLDEAEDETLLDQLVDRETGVFDGPFASFKLDEEFKRANRFHQPLSLLLVQPFAAEGSGETDLSDLVEAPEEQRVLLADVAGVFLNECRDIDVLARFTEDTFMVLMPGTGVGGATVLAERILDALREREFSGGRRLRPVAGLATMPSSGIHKRQKFLARAEACLQVARGGQGDRGLYTYSE